MWWLLADFKETSDKKSTWVRLQLYIPCCNSLIIWKLGVSAHQSLTMYTWISKFRTLNKTDRIRTYFYTRRSVIKRQFCVLCIKFIFKFCSHLFSFYIRVFPKSATENNIKCSAIGCLCNNTVQILHFFFANHQMI